jgi:hypothetical protein
MSAQDTLSYYDRPGQTHSDGTRIFQSQTDSAHEVAVADILAVAWRCEMHRFGALAPVDWYALRHGRIVGIVELKSRTHGSDKYPTVFLNFRKWLALQLGAIGLGVPASFVVRFTDCLMWAPLQDIDPRQTRVGGCAKHVKPVSDIEPVIEVPVASMRRLSSEASA